MLSGLITGQLRRCGSRSDGRGGMSAGDGLAGGLGGRGGRGWWGGEKERNSRGNQGLEIVGHIQGTL